MTAKKKTTMNVANWQKPGSAGFFAFLDDVKPMIPSDKGGFQPYVIPSDEIRKEIATALDGDFGTVILCWPRRHGKTVVAALIIVWRFLTRRTQNIALVSNSEKQTVDTAFRLVRVILEQTPYIAAMVKAGTIEVQKDTIKYEAAGSVIQGFPSNVAALYGKKLSIAQVSELHATSNQGVYQALASATIDTEGGLVLVDSTTGSRTSALYALYSLWEKKEDPALFVSHISYSDLEDAIARGPKWIDERRLRSRAKQMLPAEFAQQHLNQWTSGVNALFPPSVLDKCREEYALDPKTIAGNRSWVVGAGLDRAFGFSLHGDATVTTAVQKILDGEDEHYFVLDSSSIRFSSAAGIRKAFTSYREKFALKRAALEAYNSQDIAAWCAEQDFASEIVHPISERQSNAFTALYNAAAEGRLHIAPVFKPLLKEMADFEYRFEATAKGEIAKFSHPVGGHDDFVYSLAWALYSLRDEELNPYELNGVNCHASRATAQLCILNGGSIESQCKSECRAFSSLTKLYEDYSRRTDEPMTLQSFYKYCVRNTGAKTFYR